MRSMNAMQSKLCPLSVHVSNTIRREGEREREREGGRERESSCVSVTQDSEMCAVTAFDRQ